LRLDYWESVKNIDVENLVFLDETGILLGLSRTHARSQQGTRAYALAPFNLSGHPAVVIPIARTQSGLPIGIQIIGKRWREMELLSIAQAIDQEIGDLLTGANMLGIGNHNPPSTT
jgi:Asp-tRNA(Asn)/Glu-tRNA(Gln) amidotransferase A subunit family amidase